MTSKLHVGLLAAFVVAIPSPASARQPAEAGPAAVRLAALKWSAIARRDVIAAYAIYVANHPGIYDRANPGFRAQLRNARDAALAYASRASDWAGYARALNAFSAGLSDGHAQLLAKPHQPDGSTQRLWPGFVAAWRGTRMMVHYAGDHSAAPAGSTILGCDGKTIAEVVRSRMTSNPMRPRDAGHWWSRAPKVFLPIVDFSGGKPATCSFRRPDGSVRNISLNWSPAPANADALIESATDGERTPASLTEPRPGIFLIGLSDFHPDHETEGAYQKLFATIAARHSDLMKARAVVIDLRHNDGGSSEWPYRMSRALWGEGDVARRMAIYNRKTKVWWRTSADNIAYLAQQEATERENGSNEDADQIKEIVEGMKAARLNTQPYYVEKVEADAPDKSAPSPGAFTTPVYVITPGRCASACLDALDLFTRFENVKLIGAPTASDTNYLDARMADLPSGMGSIIIPLKVWVERPRAAGQIYRPEIEVDDLDWSTRTFLDRIDRDVASAASHRSAR